MAMAARCLLKTWVKLITTLVLAFMMGWFVVSRDIVHSRGVFFEKTRDFAKHGRVMNSGDKNMVDWALIDPFSKTIPNDTLLLTKDVQITTATKKIFDLNVFVREALPPTNKVSTGQSVLLLHGQRFSSQDWQDLGTMALLAAVGHRVVAIDLPGCGHTSGHRFTKNNGEFLLSVIEALSLSEPVLVSPSMSGIYSLQFLEKYSTLLSGFVAIAPVSADTISPLLLKQITVPTLVVHGDNDTTGLAEKASDSLRNLVNSREVVLRQAGHAAYLDQPEAFHQVIYNFLDALHE